jgi:2-oxoglutarate dehydrogenase complex dehydrogenase (E1) component-like enzyme
VLSGRCKPLVVFTPKSMLRLRAATSAPEDFTEGAWQPVIADPGGAEVRRVVMSAGKVYYDLVKQREKRGADDVALVRVEQLYPLDGDAIRGALAAYPSTDDVVWVQEEPANQGAWPFMALNLPDHLDGGRRLRRVSRAASASPAAGSQTAHDAEQAKLFDAVFG